VHNQCSTCHRDEETVIIRLKGTNEYEAVEAECWVQAIDACSTSKAYMNNACSTSGIFTYWLLAFRFFKKF
jgi:hypothetical protein